VYTRTGDGGTTRLGNKQAVPKDAARVRLYGVIDEGTSALGVARSQAPAPVAEAIHELQRELVKLMGQISLYDPDCAVMSPTEMEEKIEAIRQIVPMPDVFVEPGESRSGAALHLARTIFRRAEREAVTLSREEPCDAETLKTINRLSDYVYALAVWADYEERVERIARAVAKKIEEHKRPPGGGVTLEEAEALVGAMKEKAAEGGVPMAMAVCDPAGNLVVFARQEDVLPVSVGLAQKKAFTAAQLRLATADLARATQPGAMLWGLQADPNMVVFGGGVPLFSGGRAAGAVGVSGGSVDEDIAVAEAALDVWKNRTENRTEKNEFQK
jgi:ATP:cob(I)alamin adenosyltransferase